LFVPPFPPRAVLPVGVSCFAGQAKAIGSLGGDREEKIWRRSSEGTSSAAISALLFFHQESRRSKFFTPTASLFSALFLLLAKLFSLLALPQHKYPPEH